jgi:TPR repeat protein
MEAAMGRRDNTTCKFSAVALGLVLAASSGAARAQDENPTTPGAIPNPGSYQGSLELQRRSDQQDQQFRQQQQQQPSYQQPRYGAQPYPRAPRTAPPAPAPPRSGAQAFGKESAAANLGDKAADRGDFAGAVRIWRPLAEKGDVNAQYNMGVMYDLGHGVPMNKAEAAVWYRKAADRGYGTAMLNLAAIIVQHARGSADLVPAYTWMLLAANRDASVRTMAMHDLGIISPHMSRAEIERAEAAARDWAPR